MDNAYNKIKSVAQVAQANNMLPSQKVGEACCPYCVFYRDNLCKWGPPQFNSVSGQFEQPPVGTTDWCGQFRKINSYV